jgi:5'-methylthioadenosine phosphorylase
MSIIGIIGGSGLDNPDILQSPTDERVSTPYGDLPSPVRVGSMGGHTVCLVARHGRENTVPPTQVNYRAVISALRQLGCTAVLSTTAVGSLQEDIRRGDLVVLDQFIDFTRHRPISFHEDFQPHAPVHTPMAEPFDNHLAACSSRPARISASATTSAEPLSPSKAPASHTRRVEHVPPLGADVINMSIAPECILANEAAIPYASIAMSTDYDCWKTDEPVTWTTSWPSSARMRKRSPTCSSKPSAA